MLSEYNICIWASLAVNHLFLMVIQGLQKTPWNTKITYSLIHNVIILSAYSDYHVWNLFLKSDSNFVSIYRPQQKYIDQSYSVFS